MKKLFSTIACLFFFVLLFGQSDTTATGDVSPVPTGLRADGKIWVVMAVCITILVGLILYVISLDRKISKLEKK